MQVHQIYSNTSTTKLSRAQDFRLASETIIADVTISPLFYV